LALGAQAVLLSRPYLWGLALAGEAGVAEVCRRFLAEFDLTMVLAGLRGLDDLQEGILQHRVVRCMACGP
jgi:isopentenyl diphosphate isomerase/L-lactate dehydrogenase-like FMN-dependent dehydrogenase